LIDPPSPECRINWDPALSAGPGEARGLLTGIAIHESVAARITAGNDRYAPITLPEPFVILPPQREGETAPQADNQSGTTVPAAPQPLPMIPPAARKWLLDPSRAAAREEAMARVWDLVWWRRVVYFVSLALTLALLLLPLLPDRSSANGLCVNDRCPLPGLLGAIGWLLPDVVDPWLASFARHPSLAIVLGVLLGVAYRTSGRIEAATRATAHAAWHGKPAPKGGALLGVARRIRRSAMYQGFFRRLKWHVLPALVALIMLFVGLWLAGALATQTWLVFAAPA
jgi:hypothetical protein